DDHDVIIEGLRSELEKNNIVIVTGGLGPTKDDITTSASLLASFAKTASSLTFCAVAVGTTIAITAATIKINFFIVLKIGINY
ncbi:MAG: hypothetical protein II212_00815, partial [Alistipes sp.]|nr:hypothetical protein [Alistipes sp.]